MSKITNCKRCNLSYHRKQVVIGSGNKQANILVVGEAPGLIEDKTGKGFVGIAGMHKELGIRILLKEEGLLHDCYFANVVKCKPPSNREPKNNEISKCFPILLKQIDLLKPRIIILAGSIPAQVFGLKQITTSRGKIYNWVRGEITYKLCPIYHPIYVIRNNSNVELVNKYIKDIKQIKKLWQKL